MSTRFISWVSLGIAAAFLVVASTAFVPIDIANLALGVGIGMLVISAFLAYRYRDDLATVVAAYASAIVSAWNIVDSQVLSLQEVQNLTLANGLALLALSVIGLTAHEVQEERVVRSLAPSAGGGEAEHEARPTRMAA
jgi:hypothetical protein